MRTAWFATLIVTVCLFGIGCSGGDPGWVDSKGKETVFGQYRFELPEGFKNQSIPGVPPGVTSRAWIGPKEKSMEPIISFAYAAHDMDISVDEPPWEDMADGSLDGMRRACNEVTTKDRRRANINGLAGVRTEATGRTAENAEVHGVSYVVVDDIHGIALTAFIMGPNSERAVKRLDEALLTFRRPGYKPPAKVATIRDKPNLNASLVKARRGFKTKLTASEFPSEAMDEPPPDAFATVDYDSSVGKLGAYLTPDPGDGERHPAIIWITGGDCNTIGDVWSREPAWNDQTARAYREAGIVMMFPSLRGGNQNPGSREGFLGEVDDVLAAREFLAQQSYVDPSRIYLGGHSTGGTLVLLVSACTDRFRAVFSFGPADEVVGYGKTFLPFDLTDPRELELRSPILWLHSIKQPTFVLEGDGGNAESIPAMDGASNNPQVHFFLIEGEDHFSILAPTNKLLAEKILQDNGPGCNLSLTDSELAGQLNSSTDDTASHVRPSPDLPSGDDVRSEVETMREQMEAERRREREKAAVRQDPSHPDYIKTSLADLKSDSLIEQGDALERLLKLRPEDVTDKQTRAEIARAMRDMAFDEKNFGDRDKAIEGLVKWGGTYSVPLLLQLLDDDSPLILKPVLAALEELKDERAIEPLAERFAADTFRGRDIAKCLRAFGPQAEDAVLKHAPTADSMKLRDTIQLLGDIGTLKSIRFFTSLRRKKDHSRLLDREIDAASEAIKQRARN